MTGHYRRLARVAIVVLALAVVGSSDARHPGKKLAVGRSAPTITQLLPPNGVFTCSWIAAHPAAATAFAVSCSPDMQNAGADPATVATIQGQIARALGRSLASQGDVRVPAAGAISHGVYAATSAQYSVRWGWTDASQSETFYWYVKRNDDSIRDSGFSLGGGGGTTNLGANNYHWQVYNDGADPQYWAHVLWNDV